MGEPIFKTRCKQGKLIITDEHIRLESPVRQQAMLRSTLTGIDFQLKGSSFFGFGGNSTLIFHGTGTDRLEANWVPPKAAKQVMHLLGY